jgi:hypothetical protein
LCLGERRQKLLGLVTDGHLISHLDPSIERNGPLCDTAAL